MSTRKSDVDFSLYFVTACSEEEPGERFYDCLEEACKGGITIVQLRQKYLGTRALLQVAIKSKAITEKYKIPLLINDRLDIALAIKCGLHVGQDDLPVKIARHLLGEDAIIGVSVNTERDLREVIDQGVADYIGIGPVYDTSTKKDLHPLLGPRGVQSLLQALGTYPIKTVAIGGINESNIRTFLQRAPSPVGDGYRKLDGIAVVSAIAGSSHPAQSASNLLNAILFPPTSIHSTPNQKITEDIIIQSMCALLRSIRAQPCQLIHHITNTVVQNDTANLTLAFDCSPIMSSSPEEAVELGEALSALVLNLGTLSPEQIAAFHAAGKAANRNNKPIIYDPVGIGATYFRRKANNDLFNAVHMSVIKGNAGEIGALLGSDEVKSRGVDSAGGVFKDPGYAVRSLARTEKMIVAMSGKTDYISDGTVVIAIDNGHKYQGKITGSGCMATTAIACFAAQKGMEEIMFATVAGLVAYNVAAELAAARTEVHGPNTFRAALIDACANLTEEDITARARIRILD